MKAVSKTIISLSTIMHHFVEAAPLSAGEVVNAMARIETKFIVKATQKVTHHLRGDNKGLKKRKGEMEMLMDKKLNHRVQASSGDPSDDLKSMWDKYTSQNVSYSDHVFCENGKSWKKSSALGWYDTGNTCFEECNDGAKCCGPNLSDGACDYFYGVVKKDNSCMGISACKNAGRAGGLVDRISDGSCDGYYACSFLGYGNGSVGQMGSSCKGDMACYTTGNNGQVGKIIQGSCDGDRACSYLAKNGSVGDITNSCKGDNGEGIVLFQEIAVDPKKYCMHFAPLGLLLSSQLIDRYHIPHQQRANILVKILIWEICQDVATVKKTVMMNCQAIVIKNVANWHNGNGGFLCTFSNVSSFVVIQIGIGVIARR